MNHRNNPVKTLLNMGGNRNKVINVEKSEDDSALSPNM
jgi:hypothetical protein